MAAVYLNLVCIGEKEDETFFRLSDKPMETSPTHEIVFSKLLGNENSDFEENYKPFLDWLLQMDNLHLENSVDLTMRKMLELFADDVRKGLMSVIPKTA